jgi:putative nucleotidyltransferase with HDIG domain
MEQALSDAHASLTSLGGVVEQDLGMSAKVIQLANSCFYALPNRITNPSQAVCLLGLDIIKSLVVWFYAGAQLQGIHSGILSMEELQQHSTRVSGYIREIAKIERMDKHASDELVAAGLFHDIGKLILSGNLPQQYLSAVARAEEFGIPLYLAEEKVLGASHAEVGAYLLGLWGFTDTVVEACCYHHNLHAYQNHDNPTVCLVYAADAIDAELEGKGTDPARTADTLRPFGFETRFDRWREHCQAMRDTALAKR